MSNWSENCARMDLAAPQRNNYFYGKLLDELNLRQEQGYLNQKRWMLNRLSLGKGVLCGLTITWTQDRVYIAPGVAIDGRGREIVVPEPVDHIDPWQTTDDCGRPATRLPVTGRHEVCFCLAYIECPTDFTEVLVTDCDSSNRTAPSTIMERYAVIVQKIAQGLPQPLPPALDSDLCTALSEADPETRRADVCGVLSSRACSDENSKPCVTIVSKVTLTDGKITAVDVCSARPIVYSNPELFEMLMCRFPGGGSGLEPDLPKILDIGWRHDEGYDHANFVSPYIDVFDSAGKVDEDKVGRRIKGRENVPQLTIYFNKKMAGITRQTLTVRIKMPLFFAVPNTQPPQLKSSGAYAEVGVYGHIVLVDEIPVASTTPHTHEPYAFAACFVPSMEALASILPTFLLLGTVGQQQLGLAAPTMHIELKGDFVWSPGDDGKFSEDAVLDADNIGGRLGQDIQRQGPVKGGKNPSGNLTQGGDFESWLQMTYSGDVIRTTSTHVRAAMAAARAPSGLDLAAMPVSLPFAGRSDLLAAGLKEKQATTILVERSKRPFTGMADLEKRAKLSKEAVRKLRTKVFFL